MDINEVRAAAIGTKVQCRCGKWFKKKTKWHENHGRKCANKFYCLSRAETIKKQENISQINA